MSDISNSPAPAVNGQPNTATPQPPTAAAPTPPPPEQPPRRIRVGETELPEEEVVRGYTRAQEARKLAEEAGVTRQQALGIIQTLQNDPMKLLTDPKFGLSREKAVELIEHFLLEEIEQTRMTPEQRRIAELEEKLGARERAEREMQEKAEQERITRENAAYMNKVAGEFRQAMDRYDLPLTTETMRRMAHVKLVALSRDIELDANDVAAEVAASYEEEHVGIFKNLEGERLLRRLGPELLKKINAAQVQKYKGKPMGGSPQPQNKAAEVLGVDPNKKDAAYWQRIRDFAR